MGKTKSNDNTLNQHMKELYDATAYPDFDFIKYSTLYHYTDSSGLLGILQSTSPVLWLSRIDCLNDTDEGNDITKQFVSACESLKNGSKTDDELLDKIKNCMPEDETAIVYDHKDLDITPLSPGDDLSNRPPFAKIGLFKTEVYVCCLSTGNDLLPMWHYYSTEAYQGYCIGFNSDIFESYTHYFQNNKGKRIDGCKIKVIEVIYDDQKKFEILKNNITSILSVAKELGWDLYQINRLMVGMLNSLRFCFKNAAFKHEEEVRIVLYRPLASETKGIDKDKLPVIEYKNKRGLIIPYVELRLDKCKSRVTSVTVGPLIEKGIASRLVSNFLTEKNYLQCNVDISQVPIRY